jgi:hypothetical protein
MLGITFLAGCSLSLPSIGFTPTPSEPQVAPAWTAVLDQISSNGAISLATALQAYTLVLGPLPGVQSPAHGSGIIPSATLAESMILQHYGELTPAQQQAVLQRLGYAASASASTTSRLASPTAVVTLHGLAPTRLRAPITLSRANAARVVLRSSTPTPIVPTPAATDGLDTSSYRMLVNSFIPTYNAHLSYTLALPVVLDLDYNLKYSNAYALTGSVDALNSYTGPPVRCVIRLNPDLKLYPPDVEALVIAHELLHCYQAAIIGNGTVLLNLPVWLREGSAEWAGATITHASAAISEIKDDWKGYLEQPQQSLFARAYSAMGFFAMLDQAGASPWTVLPAMLASQKGGANNVAAYQAGAGPLAQAVLDLWASSYERDPSLGTAWDLSGPGILSPSTYTQAVQSLTIASGGAGQAVTAPAYAASNYHLTSQADVLHVAISGTSRLIDDAHVERITSANGDYCTKAGGCSCPSGSPYQGPAPTQLTGLVRLAVSGGPSGASGTVSGTTLQDFCSHKAPPTNTALCTLVSFADIQQATGIAVNSLLIEGAKSGPDYAAVFCVYPVGTQPGVAIFYVVSSQASSYYANGLATSVKNGTTTLLHGLGDAAFAGQAGGQGAVNSHQIGVYVLKGSVYFEVATPNSGDAAAVSAEIRLAQLIVSRL